MATRVEMTSSILRHVELSLGAHIRGYKREDRANNDSKYLIDVDDTSEPYVLALYEYGSPLDKASIVDRVVFFFTLQDIIVSQADVPNTIYPFPAFRAFSHHGVSTPYLDLVDESVIVVINERVKDHAGKSENVQELIDREPAALTPHLVHQAGEYLGIVHRFAIANGGRLPNSPTIDLLDIVSAQLSTYKSAIIRYNDSDIYDRFENEYRDLIRWRHPFHRAAGKRSCWCLLDYFPVNTIATTRGFCFVDFGTAGSANPIQDLAMSIDAWCSRCDDPDMELVEQFLLGYFSQCDLGIPEPFLLYRLLRLSILRWGVNRAVNRIAPPPWCIPSEPVQKLRKLSNWKMHERAFEAVLSAFTSKARGPGSKRAGNRPSHGPSKSKFSKTNR